MGLPTGALAQINGVGIGVNPPRAGLDVNNDYGVLSTGTFGTGTIPVEGAGTRLLWYPAKGAFRAGTVADFTNGIAFPIMSFGLTASRAWDDASIGNYSAAFGYACRASGQNALAAGYGSVAAGTTALAYGTECVASGANSVALGYGAHTNARQGSFVFADRSSGDNLFAGANHSANWRVAGGFRIFTSSNLSTGITLQSGASVSNWGQSNAIISTSTGAYLSTSGVWTNVSDRHRKHRFEAVAGEDVLRRLRRLPLTRWSYKTDAASVRHLGPMAQDFHRVFGLGPDSLSIGTVDADGVALAAAQALDQRSQQQQRQLSRLQAENQQLRTRLDRLEQRGTPPLQAALPWVGALLLAGLGGRLLRRRN